MYEPVLPDRSRQWIDLRSDTVTLPTAGMRHAMAEAPLGDDVFGEDPTVVQLEETIARRLGKEAAVFVPSGTMSNQIGLRLHTRLGDEVLGEAGAHIFCYEGGGPAQLSGLTCNGIAAPRGLLALEHLQGQIQPDNVHFPRTRLVALEQTANRGGGSIYPLEAIEAIAAWAWSNDLVMHLDGARLFNAVVKSGIAADRWAQNFDTISVCFSKGLGAPIGSALVGSKEHIHEARRIRKVFGGGMRQAGVIAAAALYALENHVDRLADDHAHAQVLARTIETLPGLQLRAADVETNILWIKLDPSLGPARRLVDWFREHDVLVLSTNDRTLRMVTHLGITANDIDRVDGLLRSRKWLS